MKLLAVLSIAVAVGCSVVSSSSKSVDLKELIPETAPETAAKGTQTAVFAGGCFWGVEAVFEHVKGVTDVVSGYSGGDAKTATYDRVSDGNTGHAEAVKITFDPTKVTYQQLLFVFFSVAHDPTQLNFQGPDHGTQYRSAIFFTSPEQRDAAERVKARVEASGKWKRPITTEITEASTWYSAETYHQDYLRKHPGGYSCHFMRE